jgi:hypothetical protein
MTMARSSRFIWAVMKNHALLHQARKLRSTLKGMDSVRPRRKVFSDEVYECVRFTYIACMAKAFENRKQVASIWYLLEVDARSFKRFQKSDPFDVSDLPDVCDRLRIVRDRSHFHIDRDSTTSSAFREASVPWPRLEELTDYMYRYLTYLRTVDLGLTGLTDFGYTEDDAAAAVLAVEASDTRALHV